MTRKALFAHQARTGMFLMLCGIFTFSLSTTLSHAATYYRWVDDEGVPHYTSTPPQGVASEKVTMGSGKPATSNTPTQSARQEGQSPPTDQPTQAAARPDVEYCEKAQQRLETLQSGRRLRVKTEDGGFRYLNEEDIQKELADTLKAIDANCT